MNSLKKLTLIAATFGLGIFNSADCHLSKDAARCLILELFNISQTKPVDEKVKALEESMEVCFVLGDHNDRTEIKSLYQMILGDQKINFQIRQLSVLMQRIGGSKWKEKCKQVIEKCFDDAFDLVTNKIEFQCQPFNESDSHNFVLVWQILDQMNQSIEATILYFKVLFNDEKTQIIKLLQEHKNAMLANSNNLLELDFVAELPKAKKHNKQTKTFRIAGRGGKRQKAKTPKQLLSGINFSNHVRNENLKKVKNFHVAAAINGQSRAFSS